MLASKVSPRCLARPPWNLGTPPTPQLARSNPVRPRDRGGRSLSRVYHRHTGDGSAKLSADRRTVQPLADADLAARARPLPPRPCRFAPIRAGCRRLSPLTRGEFPRPACRTGRTCRTGQLRPASRPCPAGPARQSHANRSASPQPCNHDPPPPSQAPRSGVSLGATHHPHPARCPTRRSTVIYTHATGFA